MRHGLQRKSCSGARGSATVGNVAENVAPATSQGLPFQPTPGEGGTPQRISDLPRGERRAWFLRPARLPVSLHALRTWLDSWAGIGHVAVSMARQGYDLQLTRYDEKGWRATFYTSGPWFRRSSMTDLERLRPGRFPRRAG